MHRSIASRLGFVPPLLLVPLLACSTASAPENACPLVTVASATGALNVEVCTSPLPPIQGTDVARVTVTQASTHEPVDGLSVSVVPWMPEMGHGTSVVPTVTSMGSGTYEISNLVLFMAGEWELRLTFDGTVQDTANPAFYVP